MLFPGVLLIIDTKEAFNMWSLSRKVNRKKAVFKTVEIHSPCDVLPYVYWIEKQPVRLELPVSMLRMQGAFVYNRTHPFVRALHDGPTALSDFYSEFAPSSISEMYGIVLNGRKGESLPPWELPWVMRNQRKAPARERGLKSEHGVSFYGPASQEKIDMEHERLCSLTCSIEKHGYDPDRFGDIEGHLMTNGSETCFFVRGGKHRAAALAYLGHEKIPVQLRRSWPLVVDSRSREYWPLVENGSIDAGLAKEIFTIYLRGHYEKA